MKKIIVGHKVRVNKDIHRVSEWKNETKEIVPGVVVPVQVPTHILYAEKGEEGEVIETFRSTCVGGFARGLWYAKVLMIGSTIDKQVIKTFRLTSLERIVE
ncbi:MAG: hypothetical protein E6R04_07805 [Spirochaetes bacterium]|nr:MAG: hypothetical protein E6R04_07805 [Spirochaetota bacterium]